MLRQFNYKLTFLGSNATDVAERISKILPDSSWIEKTSSFKVKTFDKYTTKVIVEEATGKSIWYCKVALIPWGKPWILNKTKLALPILGLAFSVLMGISSYKLLVATTNIENHSSKVILSTKHSTPSWSFVVFLFKAFSLSVISISTMAMLYGFWVNGWEDNNEIEYFCSESSGS